MTDIAQAQNDLRILEARMARELNDLMRKHDVVIEECTVDLLDVTTLDDDRPKYTARVLLRAYIR